VYPLRSCKYGHPPRTKAVCPQCACKRQREYDLRSPRHLRTFPLRSCKKGHPPHSQRSCPTCVVIRMPADRAKRKQTEAKKPAEFKLYAYRANSRLRGYALCIPKELFVDLVTDACFYCGQFPPEGKANGIDRVDNAKGYEVGNVVTACRRCNQAKHEYSVNSFLEMCRTVAFRFPENFA